MRISGVTLHPNAGWPGIDWPAVQPGLNAIYGAPATGKSTIWKFLAHVLYGWQQHCDAPTKSLAAPEGELVVEHGDHRYRLRRYRDEAGTTHLKIAAVEGAPVDQNTIPSLLHGLSPQVLSCLYAVSFATAPNIGRLLSAEFARDIEAFTGTGNRGQQSRRRTELVARRDLLAQELEKRIAGDRRVSQELDVRWRELDRRVREEQGHIAADEQRLQTIDAALAETDARLRYRRLELNTQLQLHADGTMDVEPELNELDHQIAKWRATLSDINERQSALRSRLAQFGSSATAPANTEIDQRTWLAMSRQLTADLAGEVARLARASQSQQCVCQDAHPRLRPIAESIQRQLDVLQSHFEERQNEHRAAALQKELEQLCRAEDELRRHVEGLLDRRQSLHCGGLRFEKRAARKASLDAAAQHDETHARSQTFSAVDAEQLERRRQELEQQRYDLVERLRTHAGQLRDLRAQRDTVERQRAALLSARSIEHVQRELAEVQRKLECASAGADRQATTASALESPVRASDFLAQLTGGELVRLVLTNGGRSAEVVNRNGQSLRLESLAAGQVDQVYLSLVLALVASASQRGVMLPIVLDDPFARLDANGTAALATVLADFCRQGHQVLVFTSQQAAAERLTSVGGRVHNIDDLRLQTSESAPRTSPNPIPLISHETKAAKKSGRRAPITKKRRKKPTPTPLNGKSSHTDRSDAA